MAEEENERRRFDKEATSAVLAKHGSNAADWAQLKQPSRANKRNAFLRYSWRRISDVCTDAEQPSTSRSRQKIKAVLKKKASL
eukprot:920635-Pleurochrysis_carterae.AAC.1